VCKGDVVVGDVVEEVNFFLLQHEGRGDGVYRRISPTFVEETAGVVERGEVINVGLRAEPVEVSNLKIGPEVAVVVGLSVIVAEPFHRVAVDNVLRVDGAEVLDSIPEGGNGLDIFVQAEDEAVLFLVVGHELERVVVDVAIKLDAGLNAPVPLVIEHQRVAEEEAGFITTHVPVADGVAVDDLLLLHLLAHLGGTVLVDEVGEGPVLRGDLAVLGCARDQHRGDFLKLVIEVIVVQEDPVVVVLAVEAILNIANRLGDVPEIRVARKSHEGGIHALAGSSLGRELLAVGVWGGIRCSLGSVGGHGVELALLVLWHLRNGGRLIQLLALAGIVLGRSPLRGRHRRGRGDEEEEDQCLRTLDGSKCIRGKRAYHEGEDDVADVPLVAGHDAARLVLGRVGWLPLLRLGRALHFAGWWVLRVVVVARVAGGRVSSWDLLDRTCQKSERCYEAVSQRGAMHADGALEEEKVFARRGACAVRNVTHERGEISYLW